MKVEPKLLKPSLSKEHPYAVGVPVEGGALCPIQSYHTEKELEIGFAKWYNEASGGGITKPVAVKKEDKSAEWDGARCRVLRGLMEKVLNEDLDGRVN